MSKDASSISPTELYEEVMNFCDSCYKEIFSTSNLISDNTGNNTVLFVRGHMDRWEALRSELFGFKVRILRTHRAKKDEYEEGIRGHITRAGSNMGLSRAAHFEERKANAETLNIGLYKELKFLTDSLEEINNTLSFIKDKVFWLKSVREEVIEEARGLFYLKNEDYVSTEE